MRKFIFCCSVVIFILSGCGVQRYVPAVQTVIRDSVAVHVKDSTVFHVDTVKVVVPDESRAVIIASSDSSHLETSVATSDAYIDSLGRLHHSLDNKSGAALEKEILVPETFHTLEAVHESDEKETVTIEVERNLTWWQKLWMASGKFFWGMLAAALLFIICRFIMKRFI